ncbi:GGDEF domain-containing protein [Romboutsia maritimum]|uniref:GGDEF domain-containing protein n=1 Tax=Romboutsia maritimum TaxID=2020948 RepID=A0A371IR69_9FIRM|nr:GGDEF domain-containing protein [Romboutsia maritimum]RDY22972.1 GGDEF domain-containing protein [Romboutsia maritimum]
MDIGSIDFQINLLKKIFDLIRIVDPINNKVISVTCNKSIDKIHNKNCYNFWNHNQMCKNCISLKAYNEKETLIKFEHLGDKTYLVMATPIVDDDSTYVVESIKDITDSKIISDSQNIDLVLLYKGVENINKLAFTDELTGAYNRRYINEKLPKDILKSQKNSTPLSLVMMDIDCFKNINDNYNHAVGDYVLKETIKIISKNIRLNSDWIARYGGEEFIIVFKNANIDIAYMLAERIRNAIQNYEFIYNNIKIQVTASFGISSISKKISTKDLLLNDADKYLYHAKINGRNRVEK